MIYADLAVEDIKDLYQKEMRGTTIGFSFLESLSPIINSPYPSHLFICSNPPW